LPRAANASTAFDKLSNSSKLKLKAKRNLLRSPSMSLGRWCSEVLRSRRRNKTSKHSLGPDVSWEFTIVDFKESSRTLVRLLDSFPSLNHNQSETDLQSAIHSTHRLRTHRAQTSHESALINRADLVEEYDRVYVRSALPRAQKDFGGIERCFVVRGDGGYDSERTVAVPDIVLQNQSRARLFDFSADNGIKINQIHLAAFCIAYFLFVRNAYSSRKNDSSAKRRSRSARRSAPSFNRFLKFARRAKAT
jgi:hypothetical protein